MAQGPGASRATNFKLRHYLRRLWKTGDTVDVLEAWEARHRPMDRATIVEHLALAEKHVMAGARIVARQRELVAELVRDGHDTTEARRLLGQFEEVQSMYEADRDRLFAELTSLSQSK